MGTSDRKRSRDLNDDTILNYRHIVTIIKAAEVRKTAPTSQCGSTIVDTCDPAVMVFAQDALRAAGAAYKGINMMRTTKGCTSAALCVLLFSLSPSATSAELEKGKSYRLMRSVYGLQSDEEVPKGSTIDEQRLLWGINRLQDDVGRAQTAREAAESALGAAERRCAQAPSTEQAECLENDVGASKTVLEDAQKVETGARARLLAATKAQGQVYERRQNIVTAETETKAAEAALSTATVALSKAQPADLTKAQQDAAKAAQDVASAKQKLSEAKAAYEALSVFAPAYAAASGTRFVVEALRPDGSYAVRMESVYEWPSLTLPIGTHWVAVQDTYLLPQELGSSKTQDLVAETKTGLVSGPLVVPFKWHFDGNDLGGSATVGAYAGYAYPGPKWLCKPTVCPTFIPLISAGLSQVSVDKDDGTKDTKSAIAIAGGMMITSWGDLNIGLVAGVDWSGDRDYSHEGEAWLSFMIGWDLASKKTN